MRDLELARAALDGLGSSRDELFERLGCVRRFVQAANKRLGRPLSQDALEDLVQDVLLRLWQKLPSYRGHAALESWAYAFCVYEALNAARGDRRRKSRLCIWDEQELENRLAIDVPVDRGLLAEELRALLDRLSPREAEVLRLRYFEGRSTSEIARNLAISPSTVKTFHGRALIKLRDRLTRIPARTRREPAGEPGSALAQPLTRQGCARGARAS